ncbi:MAG: arginase family protein [Nanoarchaeota archaeon]
MRLFLPPGSLLRGALSACNEEGEQRPITFVAGAVSVESPFGVISSDESPAMKALLAIGSSGMIRLSARPTLSGGYVRSVLDAGLPRQRLVLAGVRAWQPDEREAARGLSLFSANEVFGLGMHEAADAMMSVARHWGTAHVSLNLDVLDPAFYSLTGDSEPGGLSVRELLYLLMRLRKLKNFYSFEISNAPQKDAEDGQKVKMIAKIAASLL